MRLPPITPEQPAASRPFSRSIHAREAPTSYAAFRLFYGEEPPTLSIKDQVAVAVAERIVDGRLAAGERIPEQLISDEFNVSKAPVSEALMLLEYAGLVESAARRSAYVPRLSVQDFEELSEYRAAVGRLFFTRFVERHDAPDRQVLRDYIAAMEALVGDDSRSFEFIEIFDRGTLYAAMRAGNRRVARTAFTLSLQILRYFRLSSENAKQRKTLLELWKQAVKSLETRDLAGFVAVCEQIHHTRWAETVAALKAAA
jgi:DNA-binding GntR family transcriptional regulator